jgi:hypothetical protein
MATENDNCPIHGGGSATCICDGDTEQEATIKKFKAEWEALKALKEFVANRLDAILWDTNPYGDQQARTIITILTEQLRVAVARITNLEKAVREYDAWFSMEGGINAPEPTKPISTDSV